MSKKRLNPTSDNPRNEVDQGSDVPESKISSSANSADSNNAPDAAAQSKQMPDSTSGMTTASGVTTKSGADGVSPPDKPLDPTRYGDWVKNGRCIDF